MSFMSSSMFTQCGWVGFSLTCLDLEFGYFRGLLSCFLCIMYYKYFDAEHLFLIVLSRSPQTFTDFLLLQHAPTLHSLQLDNCHLVCVFFSKSAPIFFLNLSSFPSSQVNHFYRGCLYGWGRGSQEFLKSG